MYRVSNARRVYRVSNALRVYVARRRWRANSYVGDDINIDLIPAKQRQDGNLLPFRAENHSFKKQQKGHYSSRFSNTSKRYHRGCVCVGNLALFVSMTTPEQIISAKAIGLIGLGSHRHATRMIANQRAKSCGTRRLRLRYLADVVAQTPVVVVKKL